MKTVFLIFSYLLIGYSLMAQKSDTTLEVRLQLMQQTNGNPAKGLAISLSVINHSDQDLYIPDLESMVAYGGLHYYQEEAGQWREINIVTHKYAQTVTSKTVNGVHVDFDDVPVYKDNAISKSFARHVLALRMSQDSILEAYLDQTGQKKRLRLYKMRQPLFIKAGQTLARYAVYNIDYLLDQQMNYKIGFTLPGYFRFVNGDSTLSAKDNISYPAQLSGYKRYSPSAVLSNTLYYSTLSVLSNPDNQPESAKR